MREFEILKHIFAANPQLSPRVLIPPGDDMGLVRLRDGAKLLCAVDQLIDGRHVDLQRVPIELAGRKAITRSLSDIAAMAGVPLATLVAATLPPNFGEGPAQRLFDAMRATCDRYDCPLVGGDLALHRDSSHPLVCSVTVLAELGGHPAITRSGAKPGDTVYVTGPLGGSLQPDGLGRHLTFEPRIDLAMQMAGQLSDQLHAMIDISDGLGRDVAHIARMSNIQVLLHAEHIPCNPGCDWRRALTDGEDYELCFAASGPVPNRIGRADMIRIGEVRPRPGNDDRLVLVRVGTETIAADNMGWQHQS